jgi:hypothetical protein
VDRGFQDWHHASSDFLLRAAAQQYQHRISTAPERSRGTLELSENDLHGKTRINGVAFTIKLWECWIRVTVSKQLTLDTNDFLEVKTPCPKRTRSCATELLQAKALGMPIDSGAPYPCKRRISIHVIPSMLKPPSSIPVVEDQMMREPPDTSAWAGRGQVMALASSFMSAWKVSRKCLSRAIASASYMRLGVLGSCTAS